MKIYILTSILTVALLLSCSNVLDNRDLGSIGGDLVWKDTKLATAYLDGLYVSIPNWDTSVADATDEATGGGSWTNGTVSPDVPIWYWKDPYKSIRDLNTFLMNIQDRNVTTIDVELADRLALEARFIRAYVYFELVKRYGGVPLLLKPQDIFEDASVARTPTKECFDFIITEMEACAQGLPEKYDPIDLGRVTKGGAKAMLGRIVLFRASKQFNPSNNLTLWQNAYDINKEALQYLEGRGHRLQMDFEDLFLNEMNDEVIFAIRFLNPGRTHNRDAAVRPITFSQNNTGGCHPTIEAVDMFPTITGKRFTVDDLKPNQDIHDLWKNRDKRFYATVIYNGSTYFNTTMELNENAQNDYAYSKNMGTKTGYYSKKAIDQSIDKTNAGASGTDYIDIRLAEVMLNYAEAAIELGKTSEAFEMIARIRDRAGIAETTANDPELTGKRYGLNPNMSQVEMMQALRNERFVEFLFEQKRLWDMRRWMIYDELMVGQGKRHALVMNKESDGTYSWYKYDRDNVPMKADSKMYFLPMSRSEMTKNSLLEQTKGWENGTFDPLAGM